MLKRACPCFEKEPSDYPIQDGSDYPILRDFKISAKDRKGPIVEAHQSYSNYPSWIGSEYPRGGLSKVHLNQIIQLFRLQRLYFGEGYLYPFSYLKIGTTTKKKTPTIAASSELENLPLYSLKHFALLGFERRDLDLHFHQSDLIFPSILERAQSL